MRAQVSDENLDEGAYLAANPDVAAAVRRGEVKSGRAHFAAYGHAKDGGNALSAGGAFLALKKTKLARVRPLLRQDMPCLFWRGLCGLSDSLIPADASRKHMALFDTTGAGKKIGRAHV